MLSLKNLIQYFGWNILHRFDFAIVISQPHTIPKLLTILGFYYANV